jgi:BioD-like phosphotransacetylase family protein
VDKDAALVKAHFGLDHVSYRDSSPIIIPPGYTKDYLDGRITAIQQKDALFAAYNRVASSSDVVLCEGTGHCAVGSIVHACNAQVAAWLNAKMVLVANGGLGNTFDELELNKCICDRFGVEIAGVIINKVQPSKLQQTEHYLQLALERWGVPILACIPDRPFLGSPALADLERLFPGATLVAGQAHRLRHYRGQDLHLVATSLNLFLKNVRKNPPRSLYVCHSSRNDILLGFLMESQQRQSDEWLAGMIVTGCEEYPISTQVMEIVKSMPPSAPPVLVTPQPTREVMESIYAYTPKLNLEDGHRIQTSVEHYEPAIDFDLLLQRVGVDANLGDDHSNGSSAVNLNI